MAIALAQSNIDKSGPASSQACAYSSALTADSFLVVSAFTFAGSAPTLTVSDTGSHTWTPVASQQQAGTEAVYTRSWTAPNSGTGTPTVTVTGTASSYWVVVVSEWTGVDPTTPLDGVTPVTNSGTFSGAGSWGTGDITPASNNGVLYGASTMMFGTSANPTVSTVNGTELRKSETWLDDMIGFTAYKVQTTATTEALSWSLSNSQSDSRVWIAHGFVMREGSAGPAPQTATAQVSTLGLSAVQGAPSRPNKPTGLQATAVSSSQIDLSWNGWPGAVGWDIERNGSVVVTGHGPTSYSDTGLTAATLYEYHVRAVF